MALARRPGLHPPALAQDGLGGGWSLKVAFPCTVPASHPLTPRAVLSGEYILNSAGDSKGVVIRRAEYGMRTCKWQEKMGSGRVPQTWGDGKMHLGEERPPGGLAGAPGIGGPTRGPSVPPETF